MLFKESTIFCKSKVRRLMRERLEQRLASLKTEFEAGQKMLADLEAKQASVRETLLRISGAIQVLEETLAESESTHIADNGSITSEMIEVS
jgi:predicted nuclease with TOPRIM domain